jgi:hypothetical protein
MVSIRSVAASGLAMVAVACTPSPSTSPAASMANVAAEQQLPAGRIYVFHSTAQASCPSLDWHIVLEPGGALSGIIGWNDMKSLARASGALNMQTGTFQMTAKETAGQGRTATIKGTVDRSSGYMIASIKGPNVNCDGIDVPWLRQGPQH